MKLIFLLASLLITMAVSAQMHDLADMADGKMIFNDIVYESDGNVFGYVYLYERDVEKGKRTVEYVFLDKNLNKASNGTFDEAFQPPGVFKTGIIANHRECSLIGDSLVLTKKWFDHSADFSWSSLKATTFQYINLRDNTVSADMYAIMDTLHTMPLVADSLKSSLFSANIKELYTIDTKLVEGLLYMDDRSGDFEMYDRNGRMVWQHRPDSAEKVDALSMLVLYTGTSYNLRLVNDTSMYLLVSAYKKGVPQYYKIRKFSLLDGKQQWEHLLESNSDQYTHSLSMREVGGDLYVMGGYVPYNKYGNIDSKEMRGYYVRIISPTGELKNNRYHHWDMLSGDLPISDDGKVDEKFRLYPQRFFVFDDGSVTVLAEKVRPYFHSDLLHLLVPIGTIANLILRRPDTYGDFVLLNFTPELNLKNSQVLKKEKMQSWYSSDYLFSHYSNEDKGMVFYYTEEVKNPDTKKKELFLGIASYDGESLNKERIPLYSPKKYSIAPFPAKKGFVMLNERNEKEEYNQIRLEKLNM